MILLSNIIWAQWDVFMNIYAFINSYMDAITNEERDHEYESKWTAIWEERRGIKL